MNNLFFIFWSSSKDFFFRGRFNWISGLRALFLLPSIFWVARNQLKIFFFNGAKSIILEFEVIFGKASTPGSTLLFLRFFFFILRLNVIGLFPYIFTPSRHLVFALSFSLPLWVGSIVWSVIYQPNNLLSHLVPLGTPFGLIPVIVLIETVSSIIRPFTLAIRLAANIIAGHLLLTLLGSQGRFSNRKILMLLLVALILLLILECAVSCIQSYVYSILSSLYLNELLSIKFSKKILYLG